MVDPPPLPQCQTCGQAHAPGLCRTMVMIQPPAIGPGAPADPMIGRVVGGYELTGVLGAGSFGIVYRAEHGLVGTPVALKLLHAHLAGDPEMVRRFLGEARATTLIHHENVVQILDINVIEGTRYYLVLELLEGETLEDRCVRGPIPLEEATKLLRQICDGLSAAHVVGVVHRDLKPENIHLAQKHGVMKVKVMDFGIARRQHLSQGEQRTARGMVMGTPQYLSPEQSQGQPVDGRSDVYSVGVIMYRMLTGRLPFVGNNVVEVIQAIRSHAPPKPSAVFPGLPEAVDAIVLKALEKDPELRYQTMDQLEAALAALDQLPRQAAPVISVLERIEATRPGDHYQLLALRETASITAIRSALAGFVHWFSEAKNSIGDAHADRLEAARERLAGAEETLVTVRSRAVYDAERGNFMGVARAITNGLDPIELLALREQFLRTHPDVPLESALGGWSEPNDEAAMKRLTALLTADPLNLELHRQYWAVRRRSQPGVTASLAPRTKSLTGLE